MSFERNGATEYVHGATFQKTSRLSVNDVVTRRQNIKLGKKFLYFPLTINYSSIIISLLIVLIFFTSMMLVLILKIIKKGIFFYRNDSLNEW